MSFKEEGDQGEARDMISDCDGLTYVKYERSGQSFSPAGDLHMKDCPEKVNMGKTLDHKAENSEGDKYSKYCLLTIKVTDENIPGNPRNLMTKSYFQE